MATFYVLRYVRTMMASEMFNHISPNDVYDYAITEAGTYIGQNKQNVPFAEAAFFTAKQAKARVKLLVGHRYPDDIVELIPFELKEPK